MLIMAAGMMIFLVIGPSIQHWIKSKAYENRARGKAEVIRAKAAAGKKRGRNRG